MYLCLLACFTLLILAIYLFGGLARPQCMMSLNRLQSVPRCHAHPRRLQHVCHYSCGTRTLRDMENAVSVVRNPSDSGTHRFRGGNLAHRRLAKVLICCLDSLSLLGRIVQSYNGHEGGGAGRAANPTRTWRVSWLWFETKRFHSYLASASKVRPSVSNLNLRYRCLLVKLW